MTGASASGQGSPAAWPVADDGTAYPPEPWRLRATLLLGVVAVASDRLPAVLTDALPSTAEPVVVARRTVLGVAFVRYHPGGVLAYRELLVAVLTRGRRGLPGGCVGQIWVDSPASRAGGRALWAIPKELAGFAWDEDGAGGVRCAAYVPSGHGVAAATLVTGRPGPPVLPVRVGFPLVTVQRALVTGGPDRVTRSRVTTRVRRMRHAEWTFDPAGPLGYLAGQSVRAGMALSESWVTFGVGGGR